MIVENVITWSDCLEIMPLNLLDGDISTHSYLFVQLIGDYDIIGDLKAAFDNFVESGQIYALLIGLFVGYIFKSFTSF